MLPASAETTIPPSIFASSAIRWEEEPAAAHGVDVGPGAEHHQRTGPLAEDQLGRVPQPGSGRELFDNLE
jgi:hypothetical protein